LDDVKSCAKKDKYGILQIEVRVFVKLAFLLEKVEDLTTRAILEGKIEFLFGLESIYHFDDERMLNIDLGKGKDK
jgi:hypothetical protein